MFINSLLEFLKEPIDSTDASSGGPVSPVGRFSRLAASSRVRIRKEDANHLEQTWGNVKYVSRIRNLEKYIIESKDLCWDLLRPTPSWIAWHFASHSPTWLKFEGLRTAVRLQSFFSKLGCLVGPGPLMIFNIIYLLTQFRFMNQNFRFSILSNMILYMIRIDEIHVKSMLNHVKIFKIWNHFDYDTIAGM